MAASFQDAYDAYDQQKKPKDTRAPNTYGDQTGFLQGDNTINYNPPGGQGSDNNPQFPASATPAPIPTAGYDRQAFQSAWMGQQDHSPAALQALIAAHPEYATGIQVGGSSGDKATLPGYTESGTGIYRGPENLDLIIDAGGANKAGWTGEGGGNPAVAGGGGGSIGGGGGAAGIYGPAMNATGVSGANNGVFGNDPRAEQLFNLLMSRAQQGLNVDPNDPNIKGQTQAFNAQEQQAQRNYLSQLAEKEGPGANLTAETRATGENIGQSTGAFQAQLMSREITARRQEIQSALEGAAGFLTAQQHMALQRELQQLTLAERQLEQRMGLGQQESEFARQLAQRESEYGRGLGQRAYEYDTTRGDSLFGY